MSLKQQITNYMKPAKVKWENSHIWMFRQQQNQQTHTQTHRKRWPKMDFKLKYLEDNKKKKYKK